MNKVIVGRTTDKANNYVLFSLIIKLHFQEYSYASSKLSQFLQKAAFKVLKTLAKYVQIMCIL